MCAAANYFADASAFQSAYRAIHDAQEIAVNKRNLTWQLKVLETQGMVALIENDLECADTEFQKCFEICKYIKKAPSFQLQANAATVKLRKNDYEAAKEIYNQLLNNYPEVSDIQIKINLLVCYRELSDAAAIENLSEQIETALSDYDLDARIEARLILAKTYFHINDIPNGIVNLKEACVEIELEIAKYHRLHYRRGIRERYISRIKTMLMSVKDSGIANDVLDSLVFCSSNMLNDWFSALKWIDSVLQSEIVPFSLKDELLAKRESLICYGTPFLYGFFEKYDDPLGVATQQTSTLSDYSLPWREFSDLTTKICEEYFFPSPFEEASIQNVVAKLNTKLASASAFLFSFVREEGCIFFFILGDEYIRDSMPLNQLFSFYEALYKYRIKEIDRESFIGEINNLHKSINPILEKFIKILEISSVSEFVFMPDHLTEGLPILASILESEQLRARIKKSEFIFKICSVFKEELIDYSTISSALFASDTGTT